MGVDVPESADTRFGGGGPVNATPAGGAPAGAGLAAVVIGLPLWARRRRHQRANGRGLNGGREMS